MIQKIQFQERVESVAHQMLGRKLQSPGKLVGYTVVNEVA